MHRLPFPPKRQAFSYHGGGGNLLLKIHALKLPSYLLSFHRFSMPLYVCCHYCLLHGLFLCPSNALTNWW